MLCGRTFYSRLGFWAIIYIAIVVMFPCRAEPTKFVVDYDIVYVKQPRKGDSQQILWPEVFQPARLEPNSDLILLHPDGSEEVLVDTVVGAVTDPFVSFDGQWVYYSYFYDVTPLALNYQRGHLPYSGADIFRINLSTRQVEQLTFQEFTPNTGSGNWDVTNPVNPAKGYNYMGYGIINSAPTQIAGGKLMFTSNRNGFIPTKTYTYPTLQLFVMDLDGTNVEPIAPMSLGSVLHPVPLVDGSVLFSSYESQGLRDERLWGLWSIWPDGRNWAPVASAFSPARALHFATQTSDGSIVYEEYYNKNNFGFGTLYRIPQKAPGQIVNFGSPVPELNPRIETANVYGYVQIPFTPKGMYAMTPLTSSRDEAAADGMGKYTHPSAGPNNDLLVVWSDGPVNRLNRPVSLPAVDSGIYVIHGSEPVYNMSQLKLIKNDPNYNEAWPRAVVSYQAIHGIAEPKNLPWLPNDGSLHAELPEGTPYGLIGTSSFYKRDTAPGITKNEVFGGLDEFNTKQNNTNSNWMTQGAEAGKYTDHDIWAVRILVMEGNPARGYGPHSHNRTDEFFFNHANERMRILGEIPLKKFNADGTEVLDPEGNPDTSFLAKIPADTPFTFQTLDRNGMVLNMSQTWHQVRPGEVRTDCGGCHAHSQEPLAFDRTAAAKTDYKVWDLTKETPLLTQDPSTGEPKLKTVAQSVVNVEYLQDIRPIIEKSCVGCHQAGADNTAQLELDDTSMYKRLPVDYRRLCNDTYGTWGRPSLLDGLWGPVWRQTNASRYIRKFQSRRSLLMWKIWGARLDGWSNSDFPSPAVPGDVSTLPAGTNPSYADIDYIGDMMPPVSSGHPQLSVDEKMNVARWIDLGCPIDTAQLTGNAGYGWFSDEQRPALALSSPRAGNIGSLDVIRVGLADAYTGINLSSLSVVANFDIDGVPAGTELADRFSFVDDGIMEMRISNPIYQLADGELTVKVADNQGNYRTIKRHFSVQ